MKTLYSILTFLLISTTLSTQSNLLQDRIEITDLLDKSCTFSIQKFAIDDLSHPDQGVCKVSLGFFHHYLPDLTISLVSPDSDTVHLIGPSAFQPQGVFRVTEGPESFRTYWDIEFDICSNTVSPDPGYRSQWTNIQQWQSFVNYRGSYWPSLGCLEDFDSGRIAGEWELIIKDHYAEDSGYLDFFSIEFCNPNVDKIPSMGEWSLFLLLLLLSCLGLSRIYYLNNTMSKVL